MYKQDGIKNIDFREEEDEDNLKLIQPNNLDINQKKEKPEKLQTELKVIGNESYSSSNQNEEQNNKQNIATHNNSDELISNKNDKFESFFIYLNKNEKEPYYILFLIIIFILSIIFYYLIFKNNKIEPNKEPQPSENVEPNPSEKIESSSIPTQENPPIKKRFDKETIEKDFKVLVNQYEYLLDKNETIPEDSPIWIMWYQGIKNAP